VYDRSSADGYQQNEEDLRAAGVLAESLREAIADYQVSTSLFRWQGSSLTKGVDCTTKGNL
jgi:hypothetical protein